MLTLIKCWGALEHLFFFSLSLSHALSLSLFSIPGGGLVTRGAFNGRPHHDNPASLRESQRATGGKTTCFHVNTCDGRRDGRRDGGTAALQFMVDNEEKLIESCLIVFFIWFSFGTFH